jgi:hypothetical protein
MENAEPTESLHFASCIQAAFSSSLLSPCESRQRHQPSTVNGERLTMDVNGECI